MAIRAIFFDLDDTLVVDEAVSQEAFEVVANKAAQFEVNKEEFIRDSKMLARELWHKGPCFAYCKAIGISAFECLWGAFNDDQEELYKLRAWAIPFREAVFDGALRRQSIEILSAGNELATEFCNARHRLQRLVPDAKETLVHLAHQYRLGMLTNGAPSLQREKIKASGLAGFFDAIVVSGERGIGKPKAEIFFQLLKEMGVSSAQAVMVGNSKERDIAGARNAGIRSIWLRVAGAEELFDVNPDAEICALNQLDECIARLDSISSSSLPDQLASTS